MQESASGELVSVMDLSLSSFSFYTSLAPFLPDVPVAASRPPHLLLSVYLQCDSTEQKRVGPNSAVAFTHIGDVSVELKVNFPLSICCSLLVDEGGSGPASS